MSIEYWHKYETRKKLGKAWEEFENKLKQIPKKPRKKKWKKAIKKLKYVLQGRPCYTFFENIYKICYEFKKYYWYKSKFEKIEKLKELSNIKFGNKQSYEVRRKKKHYISKKIKCWICRENYATIQHHIILICNGGYDNGINRLKICDECHKEIHPWLKENNMKDSIGR
jgi:hypothetical protein